VSILIFDASAVIISLQGEPGADSFASHITNPENTSYISAVNMSEVFQKLVQHGVPIENVRNAYNELNLICLPVDEKLAQLAADLFPVTREANAGIADRICMATAILNGGVIITADRKWASLSISGLNVICIR
jgi:PIN domain nuclease of toxin-antitoxin system